MVRASLLMLLCAGCSLEGFAGGTGGATASGSGGTGAQGGTGTAGEQATGGGGAQGGGGGGGGGAPPVCPGPWAEQDVSAGGPAIEPSLVWAGDHWAVGWQDDRDNNPEIYFAKVGAKPLRVTSEPADSVRPAIVWTGSVHAIAWEDTRTGAQVAPYIALLDAAGNKTSGDTLVWNGNGSAPHVPALVWTGSQFVLVWQSFRNGHREIWSGVALASGNPPGGVNELRVSEAPDGVGQALEPALSAGKSALLAVWQDSRDDGKTSEIYFRRLTGNGAPDGGENRLTSAPGDSQHPTIAASADGFGVAWHDERDGNLEIYFARLSPLGAIMGGEARLTNAAGASSYPSTAATADGWAVAWHDNRDGADAIYFVRTDAKGAALAPEQRITVPAAVASRPSLAWSGSSYGVAWQDARGGTPRVYFATCTP